MGMESYRGDPVICEKLVAARLVNVTERIREELVEQVLVGEVLVKGEVSAIDLSNVRPVLRGRSGCKDPIRTSCAHTVPSTTIQRR